MKNPRQRWRARPDLVVPLFAAVISLAACLGRSRAAACTSDAECTVGFCNVRGFCESECHVDADCPCGSFCARSCGICLRNDRTGPATCFPFRHGLDTAAVLGVCRFEDGGVVETPTAASDGGVCNPDPIDEPSCVQSPPDPAADTGVASEASAVEAGEITDAGGDR